MPPGQPYIDGDGLDLDYDVLGRDSASDIVEDNDLTQAVEKGSKSESKDLYSVPRTDDPTKFYWADEKPLDFGNAEKGKTKKIRETFAVNLYHRFDEDTDEWVVSELRIHSRLIQTALEVVLEGYPGLTQHELKSFRPPFYPFIHRWQDLVAYMARPEIDLKSLEHLQLLRTVLEELLKDSFEKVREIESTNHVSFEDISLVYNPGTIVLNHESDAAGIVRSCSLTMPSNTRPFYNINVDVVDWNGRQCGLLSQNWTVYYYAGLRSLTALEVSPLSALSDEAVVRQRLIQRGRTFESLRGQHFKAYTDPQHERKNERVIVDARSYYKLELGFYPPMAELTESGQLTWEKAMNRFAQAYAPPPVPMPMPGIGFGPGPVEAVVEVNMEPLTDEQCLLARPDVRCFNIEQKKWEELKLTGLHDITWAEQAFESLVLDQGEKDLMLALVERERFEQGKPFNDFIDGKGQGMIMLLCGPPGVGKTLTAETVAEHLRRPLYRLGAGDLGIDARQVDQCLSKALKLCADFGAVLLIDEADVFMEARSTNNLRRNELVSVFLRLLEYYNGIMILTTNRMRSIDKAFESRIDVTLSYSPLEIADRVQVWNNFLATLNDEDADINDSDIINLAALDFNGRQIKSAIKTARILAAKKQEPLRVKHLEIVLNLRSKALAMLSEAEE